MNLVSINITFDITIRMLLNTLCYQKNLKMKIDELGFGIVYYFETLSQRKYNQFSQTQL